MKKTAQFSIALILVSGCAALALSRPAGLTEDQKVLHVLNRLTYGPRPGDVARVQQLGVDRFIEEQLRPERIDDRATDEKIEAFPSLRMTAAEIFERYPDQQMVARSLGIDRQNTDQASVRQQVQTYMRENGMEQPQRVLHELVAQRIVRAVSSERQLQEIMTDFWFNHFNVFIGKASERYLTTAYEMKAIRPHALGKFRNLVMATAKSSAMMVYLDNASSVAPDPRAAAAAGNGRRNQGINENYARELMELHTLGVDGGYTQRDVQEVARAFTGWSVATAAPAAARNANQTNRQAAGAARGARGGGANARNPGNMPVPANAARGDFVFRPQMHDTGEKIVLGQRIRGGGGIEDGERVIDILVRHPSAARFIATKLVQRFVNDTAPEPLVNRVAATYTKTDGDIREMLRVIFTSAEFYAPENFQAKAKSPLEFVASAIRLLEGETNGSQPLAQSLERMGQPLYRYPAPTGFPDRADFWLSNGLVLERINFAIALTANRVEGVQVRLAGFDNAKEAALHIGSPAFQKR